MPLKKLIDVSKHSQIDNKYKNNRTVATRPPFKQKRQRTDTSG